MYVFVPCVYAKSTPFLIAALRSFVNQGIARSLGYAVRRHRVLHNVLNHTTLLKYAGKKGLTDWTIRIVWRALWRYQYRKSVGMHPLFALFSVNLR